MNKNDKIRMAAIQSVSKLMSLMLGEQIDYDDLYFISKKCNSIRWPDNRFDQDTVKRLENQPVTETPPDKKTKIISIGALYLSHLHPDDGMYFSAWFGLAKLLQYVTDARVEFRCDDPAKMHEITTEMDAIYAGINSKLNQLTPDERYWRDIRQGRSE